MEDAPSRSTHSLPVYRDHRTDCCQSDVLPKPAGHDPFGVCGVSVQRKPATGSHRPVDLPSLDALFTLTKPFKFVVVPMGSLPELILGFDKALVQKFGAVHTRR